MNVRKLGKSVFALLFIFILAFALVVSPAAAEQPERVKVLIGFDRQPGPAEEGMVRGAGGAIKYTYHLVPAIAASIPEAAIQGLLKNPRVTSVEPDISVYAIDAELDNTWGVKRIGAGTVHDGGNKGSGVKVAIIDTGVDYTHPDLDANFDPNLLGYDFVNDDTDPMDDYGHGTHVAGTVAAEDNDVGVVGVAPEVELYALKVLDANGDGYYSDVIAAIQWAVGNGIQVTNNSYGSSGYPGATVEAAFDNAEAAGVLHVAAAGNTGNPSGRGDNVIYPARWPSVIAVAATGEDDNRARWSSTGPDVELAAPGVSINSTLLGGGYGEKNGTSMASPHVAGTAALVIATGITANDDVRLKLVDTADDLGDTGWDPKYGYGLVDADEAAAGPPKPAVNVALSTDRTQYVKGTDTTAELTAVVTDETGAVISSLDSTAFTTTVDNEATAVTFTETATTVGIYQADLDIPGLAEGAHTVKVTVTDTRGISGSDTAGFSVVSAVPTVTVSIDMSTDSRTAGPNEFVWAIATVTILDEYGGAVEGATVSGHWDGATSDSDSGTTDPKGDVSLQSDSVKNPPSGTTFIFVVDRVTKGDVIYELPGETSASRTIP